jgi:hypothetical protein
LLVLRPAIGCNPAIGTNKEASPEPQTESIAPKAPPAPEEQKAMELLRTDPQMRHEFVGVVADRS